MKTTFESREGEFWLGTLRDLLTNELQNFPPTARVTARVTMRGCIKSITVEDVERDIA